MIKLSDVEAKVVSIKFHHFVDTGMVACCITLDNGVSVSGQSVCMELPKFNIKRGENTAEKNARQRVRELQAYAEQEIGYQAWLLTQPDAKDEISICTGEKVKIDKSCIKPIKKLRKIRSLKR